MVLEEGCAVGLANDRSQVVVKFDSASVAEGLRKTFAGSGSSLPMNGADKRSPDSGRSWASD